MASTGILYLTQSKHGIWYYQRWIPLSFRKKNPNLKSVFRVSLRTKNKQDASRLSRILSVKIDKLALEYFDNPEQFGKAMELLAQSAKAWDDNQGNFQGYEQEFLSKLDKQDDWLHSKAEKFSKTITGEFQKLQEEIEFLKHALLNSKPIATPEDQEELVSKIKDTIYPTLPDDKNPVLDSVLNAFTKDKKTNPRTIKLFIRFANDFCGKTIRVNELDEDVAKSFIDFYKEIPVGTTFDKYTIPELLKLSGKVPSPKTLIDHFGHLKVFLSWLKLKYPKAFDTDTLTSIDGHGVEPDPIEQKQRPPFSDNDLSKLFNPDIYAKVGRVITSGTYWGPLLALFSGAREAEILQLERHDVYQPKDTNVWVFSIKFFDHKSTQEGKRAKEHTSTREVPIHQQLIKMGIIDYQKTIKKGRLFPDEPREDGRFKNFTKRFRTYRKKAGVAPEHDMQQMVFHNFRHTVRTRLSELKYDTNRKLKFDDGLIDAIVGHSSSDRSVGAKTYTHAQYVEAKNNALNLLQYDCIDFDKIIPWDKCDFARKPYREKAATNLRKK